VIAVSRFRHNRKLAILLDTDSLLFVPVSTSRGQVKVLTTSNTHRPSLDRESAGMSLHKPVRFTNNIQIFPRNKGTTAAAEAGAVAAALAAAAECSSSINICTTAMCTSGTIIEESESSDMLASSAGG
jgi:hypothetical protein